MGFIDTILLAAAAWVPARWLAQKWKLGLLVPIAALIGWIFGTIVAGAVDYTGYLIDERPFSGVNTARYVLRASAIAILISITGAIKGWRDSKAEKSEGVGLAAHSVETPGGRTDPERNQRALGLAVSAPQPSWWKCAFVAWGSLSLVFICFLGYEAWQYKDYIGAEPMPVSEVTVYPNIKGSFSGNRFGDLRESYNNKVKSKIEKPEPGSDFFNLARENFADDINAAKLNDEEFADYLWGEILTAKREKERAQQRQIDIAYTRASDFIILGLLGPFTLFGLMQAIRWHIGRFPPTQYSIHVRRGFAFAMIWLMGSITWAFIEVGDFEYVFVDEYLPLFFTPPFVIFFSFVLWSWASKTSK